MRLWLVGDASGEGVKGQVVVVYRKICEME